MGTTTAGNTGGIAPVNVSQLIASIGPLITGTTTNQSGTSTQTTTSNVPNSLLQALLDQYNTASSNATNPAITQGIVDNILSQAAKAFTPTIGAQNSSGLYNSSTLSMLDSYAQAQATAQASSAVLNYTTSQQQLAQAAAQNLIADTRSTTTTGATQQQTVKLPSIGGSTLLQGGLGIVGSIGAKALYNSDLVQNSIISPVKNFFTGAGSDAIPGTAGGVDQAGGLSGAGGVTGDSTSPVATVNTLTGDIPGTGTGSVDALSQGIGPSINLAPDTGTASSAFAAPDSSVPFEGFSDTGGVAVGDSADAAVSAVAPTVDVAAAVPDAIAGSDALASGGVSAVSAEGLGSLGGDSLAGLASSEGVLSVAGEGLSTGAEAFLSGAAGEGIADVGAGVGAAATADIGAGVGAGIAADATGTAAAGAAAGADVVADIAPIALAWIICTELKKQGRINTSFYRYGMKKFANYPVWGRKGYYLWAIPTVLHLRARPYSLYSKLICWAMGHRLEWIAASYGCSFARKTIFGAICAGAISLVSFLMAVTYCAVIDYEPSDYFDIYEPVARIDALVTDMKV